MPLHAYSPTARQMVRLVACSTFALACPAESRDTFTRREYWFMPVDTNDFADKLRIVADGGESRLDAGACGENEKSPASCPFCVLG